MRWRLSVSRTVGTAAGSALALALLVCCCVFAALAGPALSLHTRTQALHQTLAGYPNTTKTVQVTASWETFSGSLQPIRPGQNLDNVLPQALNDVGYGLRATPLPLTAGDWASLTAKPIRVAAGAAARAQAGAPPQLRSPTAPRSPATRSWWRARSAAAAFRPARWAWPLPRRRPRGSGCTRAAG